MHNLRNSDPRRKATPKEGNPTTIEPAHRLNATELSIRINYE